jgi:hypothetical protein
VEVELGRRKSSFGKLQEFSRIFGEKLRFATTSNLIGGRSRPALCPISHNSDSI